MICPKCGVDTPDYLEPNFCMGCQHPLVAGPSSETKEVDATTKEERTTFRDPAKDTKRPYEFGVQRMTGGGGAPVLGSTRSDGGNVNQVVGGSTGGTNNVAGRDLATNGGVIVQGNITFCAETKGNCPDREFYLVYLDMQNHEDFIEVCGKGSILRDEQTDEVLYEQDGVRSRINFRSRTVSRDPVQFQFKEGKILVLDKRFNSRSQTTYLNGRPIPIGIPQMLDLGDLVAVGGSLTFRVEYNPTCITVKENVETPISMELAEKLDPRWVTCKAGRYRLNAAALIDSGKNIEVDTPSRKVIIVVEKWDRPNFERPVNGMSTDREISDDDLSTLIHQYLNKAIRSDKEFLLVHEKRMRTAQGKDKRTIKEEILDKIRAGGSSDL